MKLIVVLPDGAAHTVAAKSGSSVMESIRAAGLPIRAECGGAMACATCHVAVNPAWAEKVGRCGPEENDLLDGSDYRTDLSRLSCQIRMTDDLDGLTVTLQLDAFEG